MVKADWYRDFFHGMALDFWHGAVPDEHTENEIQLLLEQTGCAPGDRVLDIPCGNGRHAVQLAANGVKVTAVDISAEFIEIAKAQAKECQVEIEFVQSDMAEFKAQSTYKAAYCLGNSFGYLEYDRLQMFLRNVSDALEQGGRFLIDATIAAECLLPSFQDRDWYEVGGLKMLLENSYDANIAAMETHYTFIRDGKIEERTSLHHVYTGAEMRRMLEGAGMKVVHLLGSTDGEIFQLGSPQMYVVAEKI